LGGRVSLIASDGYPAGYSLRNLIIQLIKFQYLAIKGLQGGFKALV
jgi:hypothetical protein